MTPLVLSLFPGADLLGMAFELEGFCVVTGPDVMFGRDVRAFHPPAGRFDGVIGGPPCQPFSPLVHMIRANGYEPKHGNLIPEFERVVAEAEPSWFLMEESPFAPVPVVPGYAVSDFVIDNATLDGGSGFGLPQMRKRRFSFGLRGGQAIDLRQWIAFAALELPDIASAVCAGVRPETPVAIGGSGTVKTVVSRDRGLVGEPGRHDTKARAGRGKNDGNPQPWELQKARAVVAREAAGGVSEAKAEWQRANGKSALAPGNRYVRTWEECCVLQGLPPDWLMERKADGTLHSPLFTKEGRFTVLGNGVPLGTGRAIAQAVRRAVAL